MFTNNELLVYVLFWWTDITQNTIIVCKLNDQENTKIHNIRAYQEKIIINEKLNQFFHTKAFAK